MVWPLGLFVWIDVTGSVNNISGSALFEYTILSVTLVYKILGHLL